MYRAVAWKALQSGTSFEDPEGLGRLAQATSFALQQDSHGEWKLLVDGSDLSAVLSDPLVDTASSIVAAVPAVRTALVAAQRSLGREGGIVVAGRDIQTVVFPNAAVKVYLTASAEERAKRRLQDATRHAPRSLEAVAEEMRERDQRDSSRGIAPLRPAPDAHLIHTDGLSAEEVSDKIVALVEQTERGAAPARPPR